MKATWPRGRRRAAIAFAALLLLVAYLVLLVISTRAGFSVGLSRDVNAQRDLIRALNYAGNRDSGTSFGGDSGQPAIVPLDPVAVGSAGLPGAVPVAAGGPSPGATPGVTASPGLHSPAGAPRPGRTPAPPASGPAAASPPTASPSSGGACSAAPQGSMHLKVHVGNQSQQSVAGATVTIYYGSCAVGSGTSNGGGQMNAVQNLAPATAYTYRVTAPGYQDATGSFGTQDNSNNSTYLEVILTAG